MVDKTLKHTTSSRDGLLNFEMYKNSDDLTIVGTSDLIIVRKDNISPFLHGDSKDLQVCTELCRFSTNSTYFEPSKTLVLENVDIQGFTNCKDLIAERLSAINKTNVKIEGEKVDAFLNNNAVIVQPKGVQGIIYNTGVFLEGGIPIYHGLNVLSKAKLAKMSGIALLNSEKLFIISLTTATGVSFSFIGGVVGDNLVGRSCNTIGRILLFPQAIAEEFINGSFFRVITWATGFPLHLNFTKQFINGPGITLKDTQELANRTSTSLGKRIVNWVAKGFKITVDIKE